MIELTDPRTFPDPGSASAPVARVHALATESLGAQGRTQAAAWDAEIDGELAARLAAGDGDALAALLASAPSAAVHRHLRRALSRCLARPVGAEGGLGVALFALPVVLVTGRAAGGAATRLPSVLHDAPALGALLREHAVVGGSQAFALANALVEPSAIDVQALPDLVAACRLGAAPEGFAPVLLPRAPLELPRAPVELPRAPVDVPEGESAHLRFLVGSALAGPGFDIGRPGGGTAWMRPFAQALGAQVAVPGLFVLALPRPPQPLPAALTSGRSAQRDVSAQLFASNALRQLRASAGEPVAVISAHRADDAPGGGELRLSLSSVLEPRDAQGFRCPVYPWERVVDVATMLVDLLHDCRVGDIRAVAGVHADRDALTGGPLLFKPATIPPSATFAVH